MVAEAAVTSRRLLVSEDKKIRHKQLNQWLRNEGWSESSRLIATTEKAHRVFNRLIGPHATYEWMLGAYLPDMPSIEKNELFQSDVVFMSPAVNRLEQGQPES